MVDRMTLDLRLYEPCAAGIKFLLAQSPDTKALVPDIAEAEWESFSTKKDVKVRARLSGINTLLWQL